MRHAHEDDRSIKPGRSDEGGFVLTWFAIMLLVLMGMAGFAVDVWNWWYTAQRAQNAADAGSLGGVVFLPADETSAIDRALDTVEQNGFARSQATAAKGSKDNQLDVTVTTTVDNFFSGLLGITNTTISRSATAEYAGRVPMGSPENLLGSDPDNGILYDFWLSTAGRPTNKIDGDRYQSLPCGGADAFCTSGVNDEYDPDGYTFVVRVKDTTSEDLNIQVWDAGTNGMDGQDCAGETSATDHLPPAFDRTQLTAYNNPVARFHSGMGIFCNGDGEEDDNVTTYITREPDSTQADDLDNPVVSTGSCAPRQYRGALAGDYLQRLLDVQNGTDTTARSVEFASNFRQWVTICTIPASTVNAAVAAFGEADWILQVRANSSFGNPLTDTTYNQGGRNHYSLRAGFGSAINGADVSVFANGRLPMHAATQGANTEFYLARVPSGNEGRFLQVEFFDVGDAGTAGQITIKPPAETSTGFTDCTFERNDGAALQSSGCTLLNVQNTTGYNGRVTTATVGIPAGYSCNDASPVGCWVKLEFDYPAGATVFDHTVWSAGLVGDPVRLVK